MWANIDQAWNVMIGFRGHASTKITEVRDSSLGTLQEGDFLAGSPASIERITFHTSGLRKMQSEIGLSPNSMDRVTLKGTPLREIREPRRLLELRIPPEVEVVDSVPEEEDVILKIRGPVPNPLFLTLFCVGETEFEGTFGTWGTGRSVFETSRWEDLGVLRDKRGGPFLVFVLHSDSRQLESVGNLTLPRHSL
jgi:hypothetical protein